MLDRFELEGVTYFQQGRRCGKPTCHCANGGELHGPYWYARPPRGKVRYVGKELPAEILRAHEARASLRLRMIQERQRLLEQAAILERLIDNRQLKPRQRAVLTAMGYGTCLVSSGELHHAQDR